MEGNNAKNEDKRKDEDDDRVNLKAGRFIGVKP